MSARHVVKMVEDNVGAASSANLRTVRLSIPQRTVASTFAQRAETEAQQGTQAPRRKKKSKKSGQTEQFQTEVYDDSYSTTQGRTKEFKETRNNIGIFAFAFMVVAYSGTSLVSTGSKKFKRRQKDILEDYATEMLQYDGDTTLLRKLHKEYTRKIGPGQKSRDAMFIGYLRGFFTSKPLCGKTIRSLAFFFALSGADDAKVAKSFLQLSEDIKKKPLIRGKVLFLAERLVKDKTALASLDPIREALAKTLGSREELDISQAYLAEASTKIFIDDQLDGGALSLDAVVEEASLLGLSEDKAKALYNKAIQEGYQTEKDFLFGDDEDGLEREDTGALAAIKEAEAAGDVLNTEPIIAECPKCGFTLFVAKGREQKFFGPDFECPDCKTPKADFSVRAPPKGDDAQS